MKLKIATFNVMNLFIRAKPLAVADWAEGRPVIEDIIELNDLLDNDSYTPDIKTKIAKILKDNNLANKSRKDDNFRINEIRKKLYTVPQKGKINIKAAGKNSWYGWVELVPEILNGEAVKNTARVINEVDADVLCLVEVEDRLTLKRFHDDVLVDEDFFGDKARQYTDKMLVDGNDPRGIDVGIYSRFPVKCVYNHITDTYTGDDGRKYPVFSRDCPEYCIELPWGDTLWVLVNHLKSKGYGIQAENDKKRERQAKQIREILNEYDLTSDLVIVTGDFNDTPDSDPLKPVLHVPHLKDVLKKIPAKDRWTYKGGTQIDYLLVSKPLWNAIDSVGVERKGIFRQKAKNKPDKMFPQVKGITTQASDHGAIWVVIDSDKL